MSTNAAQQIAPIHLHVECLSLLETSGVRINLLVKESLFTIQHKGLFTSYSMSHYEGRLIDYTRLVVLNYINT